MKTNEIRQKFLDYFSNQAHEVVSSSALVPENDPTLMFSNAGMNQFKDVFLGKEKRSYTRAVSSQKCVRAGGKHNDLENVGFTARHHTFFEMLGNFSFGDYFKKEAIQFAWNFATEVLGLDVSKIYVTVFKTDDEAYGIWADDLGVDKKHIFRLGEKDNFWQMGETGPCGPCSELFIDRGEKFCSQGEGKCIETDHDCDRYIEFWNLVFMQFDRDEKGKLNPLPKPSVDTGAGLERLAAILQGVDSNYDIDLFASIIQKIEAMCGQKYDLSKPNHSYFRVVADHARAASFLIGDGVMPSNEGRGYVLRRIIRRAVRYGKELGLNAPFLNEVCLVVIDEMKGAYPELADKKSFVKKCVFAEEEQFFRTLEKGLGLLNEELQKVKKSKLAGDVAFKLYDTYGFPFDLTVLIAKEKNITVDEVDFKKCMQQQKDQSRKNKKEDGEVGVSPVYHDLNLKIQNEKLEFVGYQHTQSEGRCLGLVINDGAQKRLVDEVRLNDSNLKKVEALFDNTPFYAEGGGQIGDTGVIESTGESLSVRVLDTKKPVGDLHLVSLECGEKAPSATLKVGGIYKQSVDVQRRQLIQRNHTATHLLHGALRSVIGDHVKQAGSLVNEKLLRFDFTHFNALTSDEKNKIEQMVNAEIWKSHSVDQKLMNKDAAVEAGAIAFFGEKYGEQVRVIRAGSYSVELCGGIHVDKTSDIQLFKIVSEGAIASGVRRIIAYTSENAFDFLNQRYEESEVMRQMLKAGNAEEAQSKLMKNLDNEKKLSRELQNIRAEQVGQEIDRLVSKAQSFPKGRLIQYLSPKDDKGVKHLRDLSDRIKSQVKDSAVVLGMSDPEKNKAFILVSIGPDVSADLSAKSIIAEVSPLIQGRGGGKNDMAQAGGDSPEALPKAMEAAVKLISESMA